MEWNLHNIGSVRRLKIHLTSRLQGIQHAIQNGKDHKEKYQGTHCRCTFIRHEQQGRDSFADVNSEFSVNSLHEDQSFNSWLEQNNSQPSKLHESRESHKLVEPDGQMESCHVSEASACYPDREEPHSDGEFGSNNALSELCTI
ncbi:hypothetical protein KIW84_044146 [Lathyrus oleraceus]|uniref:Uncharacterized protein n=1 Tax=Pisum sativum TaxID=3888 RepID=A0A9D4XFV0_PEA|nr:hypothetical protein KIW84_044146 [Pisum sativum]